MNLLNNLVKKIIKATMNHPTNTKLAKGDNMKNKRKRKSNKNKRQKREKDRHLPIQEPKVLNASRK